MPVLLHDQLSTFNTQYAVWLCFPGMMSFLPKSKQIIGAHFHMLFSTIFLFFDVPQYSNRFDYIKDIWQQFTLTTKKSLHITFKRFWWTYGELKINLSGIKNFSKQISRTLLSSGVQQNLASLGVWPTDTYSLNLVNCGLLSPPYRGQMFL